MNAIDILGSLLGGGKPASRGSAPQGRGSSGEGAGGLGGSILDELLKGALGGGASSAAGRSAGPGNGPGASSGSRTGSRGSSVNNGPVDIDREARSLEEILGVATGNSTRPAPSPNDPSTYRPAPNTRYQPQGNSRSSSNRSTPPSTNSANSTMTTNDEAIFLIQALINTAKADGRIDANEQQAILSQVPNDPATINFLKQQFAEPLDVREFAWSVPLGMEVKVYTMSLAGMQLDNQAEAEYLVQLAHGLRLTPDTCRQIHARYGAADIF